MKKYLPLLVAGLGLALNTSAAIINEPFAYSDGALTSVSSGLWVNHSGAANQVDVTAGRVNLSQSEAEDVNRALGSTYNSGYLYASFTMKVTTLPLGTGGYFFHFKDSGTTLFKARTFISTTGAAAGSYRVGIANTATPTYIPLDLSLNVDYFIVIRFDPSTAAGTTSTVWINPSSETSLLNRADASDANAAYSIVAVALRQSTSSGNGMGILSLDDLKVGTAFSDVTVGSDPALNPPSITGIPNQSTPRNTPTAPVSFYVTDGETPNGNLTLSALSSNPTLVPVNNVAFVNGGDSNRTVTVTPANDQQGSSDITVIVTDGDMNAANRVFTVAVGAPVVSGIADQTVARDAASPAISFSVTDAEGDPITLSVTSSNETVVPLSGIVLGSSGGMSNITITPAAGVSGVTRITILATDGFNTASNRFVVTVYPTRGVDLCDMFSYADGSVVTNSSFFWNTHSAATGQTGQTQVAQGRLHIQGSQGEDINAFLTNSPYAPAQGWLLYSRFTATFTALPTTDYFAHFRAASGGSFGARIFATTNGAAQGKFRIGVANSGAAPSAVVPADLDLNITYTVVSRLNVATAQSTVWVNPTSEAVGGAIATDAAFTFDVYTYAFRQSTGIGSITIDDMKVGTSFLDVVPPALTITATGNNVTLSWPSSATDYVLRYTDSFPASWADFGDQGTVQGDLKVVTLNGTSGHRFFELRKP